ncbi:MAG: N-acetylmuramoyl-L-alanine amidase, partial [Bacteroidota bacterium]
MKGLLEVIQKLFSALFSSTPPPKPDPDDKNKDVEKESTTDEVWSDSAEITRDTIIVTDTEMDFEIEPGKVTDVEEDKDKPVDDKDEPEPVITPEEEEQNPRKRYMWCLDNGHAEDTPGKRSAPFDFNGITIQFLEYEFNRDIVRRIIAALKEKDIEFFNVVPEEEEDIRLSERVRRANSLPSQLPKLYVSVHSNAGPPRPGSDWVVPSISGVETWHYHGSKNGTKMAAIFQKEIVRATGWKNRGLKSTKIKGLYVLKHTSMPAVLTENGFFNNKEEVQKLMQDDVRQAIADAHIAAILEIEKNGLA